ncbi:Cbb3-type cytochrome c oxidase CcoP subunit [Oceaniovalibus guishaninsula JLT2003]|uniref:Cbb3-type cytochrome c oxidase subunit n=1 Tax=Oceaniovalibus guishaninsula JLT2003 TaxID=1231392 RepID=K2H6R2_9RHOB|nr:cytochrome-c oxidase, cbb3-type subunit III [Oceaniovalibus guishaninsula]EKE43353.1 Cbb3-type cytochrome c oxidase CcoP subunit [Oceaniovalibus guishaninsula JLT2003]
MSDKHDPHGREIDDETGIETTGHTWDGIKELNNPLPRWWLWTFYATTVWGILYTIFFPAWPLVSGATTGLLGYATRTEVARDIEAVETANAALTERLATIELAALPSEPDLQRFAVAGGAAVFRTNCSQCHGSGAAGGKGYPNLLDDDWIWGGTIDDIVYTVRHGIRNEQDPDARYSEMPVFGEILADEEIAALVQHVRAISGQDHDAALAAVGSELFLDNCSACHMEDGTGNRELGAPNLTDAIWLYGGDTESITDTIRYSRYGVMPPWTPRLTDAEINAVSAYVHQLGGGE